MPINEQIIIALRLQDDLTAKFGQTIRNINKELTNVQNISGKLGNTDLNKSIENISKGMKDLSNIQKDLSSGNDKLDFGFTKQAKELDSFKDKYNKVKDSQDFFSKSGIADKITSDVKTAQDKLYNDLLNNKDIHKDKFNDSYAIPNNMDYLNVRAANYDNLSKDQWKEIDKVYNPTKLDGLDWLNNGSFPNPETFFKFQKEFGFDKFDEGKILTSAFDKDGLAKNKELSDYLTKTPLFDGKSIADNPLFKEYKLSKDDQDTFKSEIESYKNGWEGSRGTFIYDDKLADIKDRYNIDDVNKLTSKPKESSEPLKPSNSDLIDDYKKVKPKEDSKIVEDYTKSSASFYSPKLDEYFKKEEDKSKLADDFKKAQEQANNLKTIVDSVSKTPVSGEFSSAKTAIDNANQSVNQYTESTKTSTQAIKDGGNVTSKVSAENQKAIDSNAKAAENTNKSIIETGKSAATVAGGVGNVTKEFNVLAQRGSRAGKNIASQLNTLEQNFTTLSGAFTGFLGLLGMGTLFSEIWSATTIREGNKIMLSQKRSAEEVTKLYDTIQQKVLELPGDDTFFTNLMTMASTMDTKIGANEVGDLGETIANYYALAKAKGENDYETQKDIRSYILSGNTRNFLNSAISTEIATLKNKNSITERSIALQKAMQNANVDGMARYKSLGNTFEEFKGHFQKAFADVGDNGLWFIKLMLQMYNAVDTFLGTGLSQFLITISVLFLGGVGGIFAFKKGIELTVSSVNSLVRLSTNVTSFIASIGLGARGGASAITSLSNSMKGLLLTSSLTDANGLFGFMNGQRTPTQNITRLKKEMIDLGNVSSNTLQSAEIGLQSEFAFGKKFTGEFDENKKPIYEGKSADYNNIKHRKTLLARAMAEEDMANDHTLRNKTKVQKAELLAAKEKEYGVKVEKQLIAAEEWRNKSLITKISLLAGEIKATIIATAQHIKKIAIDVKDVIVTKSKALFTALKTLLTDKDTIATLVNEKATVIHITSLYNEAAAEQVVNAYKENALAIRIYTAGATIKETVTKYAKLTVDTLERFAEESINFVKEILIGLRIINANATTSEIIVSNAHSDALLLESGAETTVTMTKGAKIAQSILSIITTIGESINNFLNAASLYASANAESRALLVKEGNIFAKIESKIQTISEALANIFKTTTEYLSTTSTEINTFAEYKNAIAKSFNTKISIVQILKEIGLLAIRVALIPVTLGLAIANGILTTELIAEAAAFLTLISPVLIVIGLLAGLVIVVEKVGEMFGWWKDLGSMFDAIKSGIMRVWNAFMNSAPIKSITNLVYTLQKAIGGVISVLSGLWNLLFGGIGGSFDIVSYIINFLSIIGNIAYYISGLWVVFSVFDAIGKTIGQLIDAVNLFWKSALANELITSLSEAFNALKEPFQEIWDAFSSIGDAFREIWVAIFGESKNGKKEFNVFIEIIKGIAKIIINVVVPAIKMIAFVINVALTPIKIFAHIIQIVVGLFSGLFGGGWDILTKGIMGVVNVFRPLYEMIKWIVDSASGVWEFFTGKKVGGDKKESISKDSINKQYNNRNLAKKLNPQKYTQPQQNMQRKKVGSKLGSNYSQTSNSHNTVVYNNFAKDSIPIDARNMTQKEAAKTIQTGLGGYLKSRKTLNK